MESLFRRLRWPVLRRMAVHPGGDERSSVRGLGIEYNDVREYQPGDDPRLIDWNLTARSDTTYVRESYPERGLDVWLLVDTSASLDWGTARCLKSQIALEMVAAATQLLARHGNRVGAALLDHRVHQLLEPVAGRTAVMRLVAQVDRGLSSHDGAGSTDLGRALTEAGRLIRRRSLVLVISDFLGEPNWGLPLRTLCARHEVIAARVLDPREQEIPDIGVVTFEDPESGRQLQVDTSSRRLRDHFRQAAEEQRTRIQQEVIAAGAGMLELTTAEDLLPQLMRFFRERRALLVAGGRGLPG
ncbi:MAG: DUF58 domain-containing protein [Candidatus Dormibacteraeota bacterium]|nr:DUF58 domain-containing protein [Candidatus Dormibacteraeota bacterium]